jgi:UDP-2,3-diacylglucosamine pyrophosphatase LpxH
MIIVTDAHISKARGNHKVFYHMLEAIEKTEHDLIFLGDIFELWVALPRYETDIHSKFIAWCLEQKKNRTIGFLEGNHEYYLASQRAEAFTWCSNDAWWQDDAGTLYVHGDQINRSDRNYLLFKKLIKNSVSKYILQYLPFGPKIADSIKTGLKNSNYEFRIQMPWDEIKFFADNRFAEGADTIFMGHFHQEYCYRNRNQESKKMFVLPDWLSTQKITLFQKDPLEISTRHWKELLLQTSKTTNKILM